MTGIAYCNEGGTLHQWMHRPGGGVLCTKCGLTVHALFGVSPPNRTRWGGG